MQPDPSCAKRNTIPATIPADMRAVLIDVLEDDFRSWVRGADADPKEEWQLENADCDEAVIDQLAAGTDPVEIPVRGSSGLVLAVAEQVKEAIEYGRYTDAAGWANLLATTFSDGWLTP